MNAVVEISQYIEPIASPISPFISSQSDMDTQEEKLDLTSLDPCRTTLVNASNPQQVVYSATTDESGSKPITTFVDASGSVIATLEWHLHTNDKLSIRGTEKSDVSKWLQRKKWRKGQ